MSGKGHGVSVRPIARGDQNDIRKARSIRPVMKMIERGPKPEESNLRFQVFDLTLELFLSLISFIVALLARSGVAWPVILQTRQALHHFLIGLAFCVRNGSRRQAPAALHRKICRRRCDSVKILLSLLWLNGSGPKENGDWRRITFRRSINFCCKEKNNVFLRNGISENPITIYIYVFWRISVILRKNP